MDPNFNLHFSFNGKQKFNKPQNMPSFPIKNVIRNLVKVSPNQSSRVFNSINIKSPNDF